MRTKTKLFSVRRVEVKAKGYTYWQWKVEGRINGLRYRRHFSGRAEAEGHCNEMEVKAANESLDLQTTTTRLNPAQVHEAEAAFAQLGQRSLLFATDWFLTHFRDPPKSINPVEARDVFLKEWAGRISSQSIRNYRLTLADFVSHITGRSMWEITTEEIADFLKQTAAAPKTWNNKRGILNAFFEWSKKSPRGWILENPVIGVERKEVPRGIPTILTAKQVTDLMRYVEEYAGGKRSPVQRGALVPYFTLALFAGLRPAVPGGEIWRLGKLPELDRNLDLPLKVIRITPEIAKTRDLRQVTIQPNLLRWLRAYPVERFPIIAYNLSGHLTKIRKRFDLSHDVLRHTFISMHVVHFKSMGDTALQAGNSEAMIKKHYLNLVTPSDAAKFWKTLPSAT